MTQNNKMTKNSELTPKKKKKGLNVFVLLFIVLVVSAIFTYILPAGEFERETVDGREVVVPGSYEVIEKTPVDPFDIFTSIHSGLVEAAPIVFYVIIIGGMFQVVNSTGAIDAFLGSATKRLRKRKFWFVAALMFIFSLGGSFIGMSEESLMYIPIVIPIALALGFDVVTGTAIVILGMGIGFTTAVANPFTIGIAQAIAELPPFSGIGVRVLLYGIFLITGIGFVYRYAMKVNKNPDLGFYGDGRYQSLSEEKKEFTLAHKLTLIAFVLAIATIVTGTIKLGWYMGEMSAVFIILVVVVAIINKMSQENLMKEFINGCAGILGGALVVGLARGIVVVLTNGHIIDTILNFSANALDGVPHQLAAAGMFVVQATIHLLVPSGSGQAMLTMPIMVPLADLSGVTHQTACLIFSLADGIGNTILPTSGYFMAALAIAGVPWQKWVKVFIPLIGAQYIFAIIAVIIANTLNYGPF